MTGSNEGAGPAEARRRSRNPLSLRLIPLLLLACAAWLGAGAAAAEPELLRIQAERALAEGHCERALPLLVAASDAAPADAELWTLRGRCALELERHPEAARALAEAERLAGPTPELMLDLAIARYHSGDFTGSEEALTVAAGQGADAATLDLYRGLLELQSAENRQAALFFERAGQGASPLAPSASYHAALAWSRIDERERAVAALERVIERAPDSRWAAHAREVLESAATSEPRRGWGPPFWAGAAAGVDYDSNVILRGDASVVPLPADISRQDDGVAHWRAWAGAKLFESGRWSVSAQAAYAGNTHFDSELRAFDAHVLAGALWLDHELSERTLARLRYDLRHAWVDGDALALYHDVTASLYHDWGRWGDTELFAAFLAETWDGEPIPALDRDGFGTRAGLLHRLPVERVRSTFRGGYRFEVLITDGTEYDVNSHRLVAGVRSQLPLGLRSDVEVAYTRRNHREASVFFEAPFDTQSGPERRDDVANVSLSLERDLVFGFVLEGHYRFTENDSNVAAYDFRRHVAGFELRVQFD